MCGEKGSTLLLLGLLGKEHCLDVWQHTALSDGHARQELVKLLVVADGQLQVTWDDASLLVVTGSVAGKLQHLSSQVLHNGCQVDRGASTHALGVVALPQETMDPAHGELKTSPAGAGLGLALHFSSLAASRHGDAVCM